MIYRSSITETTNGTPTTITTSTLKALDTIIIQQPDTVSLGSTQPFYCSNNAPDTLKISPKFDRYKGRHEFELFANDSAGTFSKANDNVYQDAILQLQRYYSNAVPNQDRDLKMQLYYTVDRFGCKDTDSTSFTILAPLQPTVLTKPAYCKNEAPILLSANLLPGSIQRTGIGTYLNTKGLDSITGTFSPTQADLGETPFTYIFTDNFHCQYTYQDTLFVREPPRVEITLDSSTNTKFCASASSVVLNSNLLYGSPIDTVRFFGQGVIGNTFTPNSVFPNGGSGTASIWTAVTDSFGCKGYDSTIIEILPAPPLDIDTAFNKRSSNYGPNNIADHTYCKSEPSFIINAHPFHFQNGTIRGIISGNGVQLTGTTYRYDPSSLPIGQKIDIVTYTYTDVNNCQNTDMAIIKLNEMPTAKLTGFTNTNFCPNDTTVQLIGTPSTDTAVGKGFYKGKGVNPNTGLFTPATAGIGTRDITYTFTDLNQCVNTDTVEVTVNPLPTLAFTGYKYEYCSTGAMDTLISLNDSTKGTYRFFGNLITDSKGLLQPDTNHLGPQKIYYAYTDISTNCTNTDSVNVFVHSTTEISLVGLQDAYCKNAPKAVISVIPATVLGGLIASATDRAFSARNTTTILLEPSDGKAGVNELSYSYTDKNRCSDTITAQTTIHQPATPSISNLDSFYCENRDTIRIIGSNSMGVFSGAGIGNDNAWFFDPSKAGAGKHKISYAIQETFKNGNLVCTADTMLQVIVQALPIPKILAPSNNSRFCSTDAIKELQNNALNTRAWHRFTSPSNGISFVETIVTDTVTYQPLTVKFYPDTTYYFNPDSVDEGTHFITYTVTDSATGCRDSIQYTYIVDEYVTPFFLLDSTYCESADSVLLYGVPSGGIFIRNQDTIVGNPLGTAPYFQPNKGYSSSLYLKKTLQDTVTYTVVDGACEGIDTQLVTIFPVHQISFTSLNADNIYCLGGDPVPLTPTRPGGVFTGNGVPFGSTHFFPDLAGAGIHTIYYDYLDDSTHCATKVTNTLSVYGMPELEFDILGGCQGDSIKFFTSDSILGLGKIFQNKVIDSITQVTWFFSATDSTTGVWQKNTIDTIKHKYTAAGVYNTQLIVANQQYCIDTQIVRWVISPTINSFPYEQDFETDSGNWFAESRTPEGNQLWQWGTDNNSAGIQADPNNHLWSTQNNSPYIDGEDAWVYSPCFDLDSLDRPMISLDYWSDTRSSADGTVLEYQRKDGTWTPLGRLNRGINWYNSPFISGQPGNQFPTNLIGTGLTAPLGWSGKTNAWTNGRYRLDEYKKLNNTLRLRFAFASTAIPLDTFLDGYAFDNVIVRNRTRNVLLETMANVGHPGMQVINNHSYKLVSHPSLNKDVILLQYQIESPNAIDEFFLNNPELGRTRAYEYAANAARAYIDGDNNDSTYATGQLNAVNFEQHMLESPKFEVKIDTFTHINNSFKVTATVTALDDLPLDDYRIYTVVSEDNLYYSNTAVYKSPMHAVARENDQYHLTPSINTDDIYSREWKANESKSTHFLWPHANNSFINYKAGNFQAIVFIQNINTKEIFQVATTRDVSGYWVGIEPAQAEAALNEIQNMNLFPNPAHDYFNISFEQSLKQDYQWKLVNVQGVTVKEGQATSGNTQVTVDGLDCPAGTYVLLLYNDSVFVQRRVVLGRP